MRVAIFEAGGPATYLGARLARGGHDVVRLTADPAGCGPVDVMVVTAPASQAQAAIDAARSVAGRDAMVVALVREGADRTMRVTLGELDHGTTARVVRLALALDEVGIPAEVSVDIHAAMERLRGPQEGSAGRDGSGD